jgi:hypothetical protein
VSTAQTRPQNSKASFAHQHHCGLKSALRRSRGDHAKHIPATVQNVRCAQLPTASAPLARQFDWPRGGDCLQRSPAATVQGSHSRRPEWWNAHAWKNIRVALVSTSTPSLGRSDLSAEKRGPTLTRFCLLNHQGFRSECYPPERSTPDESCRRGLMVRFLLVRS